LGYIPATEFSQRFADSKKIRGDVLDQIEDIPAYREFSVAASGDAGNYASVNRQRLHQ
jgi:hypothetical protein